MRVRTLAELYVTCYRDDHSEMSNEKVWGDEAKANEYKKSYLGDKFEVISLGEHIMALEEQIRNCKEGNR